VSSFLKLFPRTGIDWYLHSIQLIERFYDPLAGNVYVGYKGIPLLLGLNHSLAGWRKDLGA